MRNFAHSTQLTTCPLLYLIILIYANCILSFVRLREAEVEQEEAEAEVTHEKNQRLKEFKSEVEVKSAELEHIKSEVTELSDKPSIRQRSVNCQLPCYLCSYALLC